MELCVNREKLKIDMDRDKYSLLESANALYLLAARRARTLVGYLFAFVLPHFHYKSSGEVALTDMYWVRPEERNGIGRKLFDRFESDMRKRGTVVQLVTSCKVSHDHTRFFELLGWQHTDNTLVRFL